MASSSLPLLPQPFARIPSSTFQSSQISSNLHNNIRFASVVGKSPTSLTAPSFSSSSTYSPFLRKSIAFAASISLLMWPTPANAGFLSGFSGIESVPGPELPQIDFLNRFNEENQKKYAEADARFKSSPLLKELLERSKMNKEKNRQKIVDKYCIRGAEWGVGDCSAEGMSPEERDKFISMLKQKAGVD
ncbi:hypothetical protein IC582_021155 [Cucumis melo]|uniref:Uncharacterized protein LOC103503323 n=2 Tax=Cucumis melo TaxID=3656 RepID=A0A1S3CPH3_CUCME|nr:uncharacterized protein LOC103503323 [Cucumis melo]KAA0040536.1 uncharacterized protein E6C27_scaffold262G00900 [Cucumis melo var. makuwa]TYK05578.1 uncharacterized protein E5676_scaffold98G00210 [Cucumis melo var. makuwa]